MPKPGSAREAVKPTKKALPKENHERNWRPDRRKSLQSVKNPDMKPNGQTRCQFRPPFLLCPPADPICAFPSGCGSRRRYYGFQDSPMNTEKILRAQKANREILRRFAPQNDSGFRFLPQGSRVAGEDAPNDIELHVTTLAFGLLLEPCNSS